MLIQFKESWEERVVRLGEWHRYFAWLPVAVSDKALVWLGFVERRGDFAMAFEEGWRWEYRRVAV